MMKRFQCLLVAFLCVALLVPFFCLPVYGDALPTWEKPKGELVDVAVQRAYMVHFEAGKEPDDLSIPEWLDKPYCELVSNTREGAVYYLWFQISLSQSQQFEAFSQQAFTPQYGVLGYQNFYKIPYREHNGDINHDGILDARDALLCLQMAVDKYVPETLEEFCRALVSEKGLQDLPLKPNAVCAMRILHMAVTQ